MLTAGTHSRAFKEIRKALTTGLIPVISALSAGQPSTTVSYSKHIYFAYFLLYFNLLIYVPEHLLSEQSLKNSPTDPDNRILNVSKNYLEQLKNVLNFQLRPQVQKQ